MNEREDKATRPKSHKELKQREWANGFFCGTGHTGCKNKTNEHKTLFKNSGDEDERRDTSISFPLEFWKLLRYCRAE